MSKKMKIKDIVTVTLLAVCNAVIYMLGGLMSFSPVTMIITPVLFALLQSIAFFMLGIKVKKTGAILLYCIIQGLLGFYMPYAAALTAAGVIAEIIMAVAKRGNLKGLTVSYTIIQVLACVFGTIYPYTFSLEQII